MVVTDDLGCSAEQLVEYEILEPVLPTIRKDADAVCKDGVDDFIGMELEFVDVGNGPYTFEWDSNPVGLDFYGANDEISVIIDDENSASRSYTVVAIVTDDFGCEYRAETSFIVDNGPEIEFEIDECFGSGFDLNDIRLVQNRLLLNCSLMRMETGTRIMKPWTMKNLFSDLYLVVRLIISQKNLDSISL